jgi:membrane fusion protein (multidrug efflux system)
VAGMVQQMLVEDNQSVSQNQLLAVIDTSQQRARYEGLKAQASQARSSAAQVAVQVDVARQQVAAARARAEEPQAAVAKARADLARYRSLQRLEPGAVAGQQLDAANQAVRTAQAQRDAAARQVGQEQAQLTAAKAAIDTSQAAVDAADAQVRAAGVDLKNSRIMAPIAGRIANRNVALGSYVQPGQEIMAIVPTKLWVTANFKETQLTLLRIGQSVDITVDAFPNVVFTGHVESMQPGAGQAFALLPAENASGNFVKVVQRVPVRIAVDPPGFGAYPVGPGMSVVPRVKVR